MGMATKEDHVKAGKKETALALRGEGVPLRSLAVLSGRKILDRILEAGHPETLVRQMAPGDFYWLVKKLGEAEAPVLLRFASDEQRQYLLDLEIWEGSRPQETAVSKWLERLFAADPKRLARWLLEQGSALAYQHFSRVLEVIVTEEEDDVYDLPPGCFSVDGVVHVRARDAGKREEVENILRAMADENLMAYEAMLLGLGAVLPAELEEQMYRVRNVRLAEHGFLPFEEAQAVYAPLEPERLAPPGRGSAGGPGVAPRHVDAVPVLPMALSSGRGLVARVFDSEGDPEFQDRLRLEFAGLCNQILSAEGLTAPDWESIARACTRAAAFLNLALERLSDQDPAVAEAYVRANSLVDLFRAGQTLALKVKWEAERWLNGSWFRSVGFGVDFWGEGWGGTLQALLSKRPLYRSPSTPAEKGKDFERMTELASSVDVLRKVMVLDGLLERLVGLYALPHEVPGPGEVTYRQMLFNLWSRLFLGIPPSFEGISLERTRELFRKLRAADVKPPYRMEGFDRRFAEDFMRHADGVDPGTGKVLRESLGAVWEEFREEYAWVSLEDLDGRYAAFVTISTTETAQSGQ